MIRAWDGGADARGERLGGAAATFAVHVLLGLGLLWGLGAPLPRAAEQVLEAFAVAPPQEAAISIPPPPPVSRETAERRRAAPDREGAAAPPNLRSEPTPVVAPTPLIPMPVPPPIAAAPIAGQGSDPSAGAAPVRGPGTGAGGFGVGRGSGYGGDGGGGGGGRGFGRATPPRHISGRITEIPSWAWEQGMQGTVGVRYSVGVNGRVVNCRITRSSGYRELDTHTCDLIQRRFRFAPARDEDGEPFQADIVENHSWEIRDEPEREDY
ncbi:energy transducer TonB [Sphingosinicella sp.]|uniref:energy transducer TonB n=1 Tax=Sphingosinicella sp. TaxID=1917971 RepID=UPI00403802ED